MSICVIGLGKLGYPMAEFLSSSGESINCYDINEKHVLSLSKGESYLEFENGLEKFSKNGNDLNYFLKLEDSLKNTDICFVTVPTPSDEKGSFKNEFILKVLDQISDYIITDGKRNKPYIININSTVMPYSFKEVFIPFMKQKGLIDSKDFSFIYNPYFVALGEVVKGLENPDIVLIGNNSKQALNHLMSIYTKIYDTEITYKTISLEEAEFSKLLINSYLTLKISFSNMVKSLVSKDNNINLNKLLDSIGSDQRIGNKFLKPGGPFSGPCLPRDTIALNYISKKINIDNEISSASIKINLKEINNLKSNLNKIKNRGFNSIIFAGVGYKALTPTLEESFIFELIEYSNSINLKVFYYDEYIMEKIKFATRIKKEEINKYANIIFLPYIDKKFNNLKFNGYIYDIWHQINTKNVIRNDKDLEIISRKSNVINF